MLLLCHLTHNFVPCWPECGEHDPRPHREACGEGLHRGHGARPPGAGGGHQHQQHWHRPRQWGGRSHRASLVIRFFHFHYSILFPNFIIQGCQGATETGKSVECEGGWTYRKTHSTIAKIDEFTGGCSGHGAQFKHWLKYIYVPLVRWQLQKSMLCFVLMLLPRPWSGSSVCTGRTGRLHNILCRYISRGIKLDNARIARYVHIHGILVHSIMGILYSTGHIC